MWRKQEQPKSSQATTEAAVPSAVETALPVSSTPAKAPQVVLPGSRLTGALKIKGEITGNEDLLIDAPLEGLVHLVGATAVVGPSGRVIANITATQIVIEGDVEGSLHAADSVRIRSTGKTRGNISSRRIGVDEGAEIHGSVEVTRDAAAPVPLIPSTAEIAVPRRAQAAASLANETSAA